MIHYYCYRLFFENKYMIHVNIKCNYNKSINRLKHFEPFFFQKKKISKNSKKRANQVLTLNGYFN